MFLIPIILAALAVGATGESAGAAVEGGLEQAARQKLQLKSKKSEGECLAKARSISRDSDALSATLTWLAEESDVPETVYPRLKLREVTTPAGNLLLTHIEAIYLREVVMDSDKDGRPWANWMREERVSQALGFAMAMQRLRVAFVAAN